MQAGVVGTRMNWTEIFTAPLEHAQQIAAYASPKTTSCTTGRQTQSPSTKSNAS